MSNQVSFTLSQIPKDLGGARFEDLYFFVDNLSESDYFDVPHNLDYPVKSETMLTLVLTQGYMTLRINLQEVQVHAGQGLGLMPGCIFQILERSSDMRYYCMMISPEVIDSIQKSFGVHMELSKRYYNFRVHTMTEESVEIGLTMYKLIKEELSQPDYDHKKDVIQRYCEIWILKNISSHRDEGKTPDIRKPISRKEQIFRDFLTLLEQYYKEERSISFYADRLCLTPKYLSTIIKEISGKHGMQWIDEYVALEAKALLREGNYSVKQVSDILNFPSQSMFGRFFKKMTGYSPKQYMLL